MTGEQNMNDPTGEPPPPAGPLHVVIPQSPGFWKETWRRFRTRKLAIVALAPVLVPITFGNAAAILIESSLSFLGFGTPPPNPSWDTLLNAGRTNYQLWRLIVFPGTAIFLAVLAYNLIGQGLQEAADPRLRDASD